MIYFWQYKNTVSGDTFAILFHNRRSLWKHVDDTVSDDRVINTNSIGFAETQINLSDSSSKVIET